MLEGLHNVEIGALALGDTVLAVELELGNHDGVLAPAVHVEGSLGEHEGAGVGESRAVGGTSVSSKYAVRPVLVSAHSTAGDGISGTGHLENTSRDEGVGTRGFGRATEDMDGRREGINGIGVVERLGTKDLEESGVGLKGGAVIHVGIGLDNPDELLAGVVEVNLNLVTGRSDRLVTGVLELLNEVLVGVLGHLAALVSVEEDEIDIDRGSNQGLLVGSGDSTGSGVTIIGQGGNSPEALTNGAEIDVNLNFVILKSDQRQSKTGVSAEPEQQRDVQSGLGQGLAGSADLAGAASRSTRAVNVSERGVSDVGQLGGVTNHLVVTSLLLSRQGKLVPDVHPVTILAVNALATNLNLNLSNQLLTGVIQPTSINAGAGLRAQHGLVNLGQGNLHVGAVSQVTIAGNGARNTATEVSLAVESLLNRLHGEVGVASVGHLPESNLGASSKENVLCAIGD